MAVVFAGVVAAVWLVVPVSTQAEPLPPAARAEVTALLARLEGSGCSFNRNATWHNSRDARRHLERKLEYVEKNAKATSAEAFIALAATSSSSSGKPYQVQCPGEQAVPSAAWLGSQLAALRKSAGGQPVSR